MSDIPLQEYYLELGEEKKDKKERRQNCHAALYMEGTSHSRLQSELSHFIKPRRQTPAVH